MYSTFPNKSSTVQSAFIRAQHQPIQTKKKHLLHCYYKTRCDKTFHYLKSFILATEALPIKPVLGL